MYVTSEIIMTLQIEGLSAAFHVVIFEQYGNLYYFYPGGNNEIL